MLKKIINQPKTTSNESTKLLNLVGVIIALFIVFYILHIWADFIVPFIIALLMSFWILGLSNIFKSFRIPWPIAMVLSLACFVWVFWLIWNIINVNIQDLQPKIPEYQIKLWELISSGFTYFNIQQPQTVTEYLSNLNFISYFRDFASAIANIFSKVWIIMFYVLFILLEHRHFSTKLKAMIHDENQENKILSALHQIKTDVGSYFLIKTWVSLITATLSYMVMMIFWVDFALFWAFVIFAFNFIPTVGSVIAVLFPVALALVQFDSYYSVIFLLWWLSWVQVLMWNIVEPKFVGNKLNLSPLLIILSLGFWGYIWGIPGMILSVPIMVILNIILSKFNVTKPIAVLFSEKWDLKMNIDETEKNRKELVKKLKKRLFM